MNVTKKENTKSVIIEICDVFHEMRNISEKAAQKKVMKKQIEKAQKEGYTLFKVITHATAERVTKRPLVLGLNGMYMMLFYKQKTDKLKGVYELTKTETKKFFKDFFFEESKQDPEDEKLSTEQKTLKKLINKEIEQNLFTKKVGGYYTKDDPFIVENEQLSITWTNTFEELENAFKNSGGFRDVIVYQNTLVFINSMPGGGWEAATYKLAEKKLVYLDSVTIHLVIEKGELRKYVEEYLKNTVDAIA